jgi:hypothetical protein
LPRPRPSTRRLLGLGTATALALTGLALTAPTASAAPWTGQLGKGTDYGYSGTGCTPSSTGIVATPVAMPANVAVPLNVADSATGTGPSAGDTGAMSASVTGTALIAEGAAGVTSIDVSADLAATASRALGAGSACEAEAASVAELAGTFSTTASGLLDLHISNLGSGFSIHQLTLVRNLGGLPAGEQTFSINEIGRTHRLLSVQPGDYQVQLELQVIAISSNTSPAPPSAAAIRFRLHGDFRPFGVADGAQSGSGSKYVTLAGGVTCASHSVTADFTKKAGKKAKKGTKPVIGKATFYVNGVKVKTAKKPHKKTHVTLAGVPDDLVTVTAKLKVKGKGTLVVERDYLPCS